MGIEDINNNPNMIKMWLNNEKAAEEQYYKNITDSFIPPTGHFDCFSKNKKRAAGMVINTTPTALLVDWDIKL